jgi:hypothetical protein
LVLKYLQKAKLHILLLTYGDERQSNLQALNQTTMRLQEQERLQWYRQMTRQKHLRH